MLCWKWIVFRVGVILAISAAGSEALSYPISSNTSTVRSTSTYIPASTTTPDTATITSCGATLRAIDFLVPSLRTLPSSVLSLIYASEFVKIEILYANFLRIQASTTNLDASAFSSYLSSLYSTVEADVTSLFGPAGNAVLSFQSLASDPCLYTSCFSQFLAQRATFAVASPSGTFFYTAQPPCCLQCTVYGQGVQLEYWPTPAPQPPVSTLIDEKNNYTFVSPSAYAVFTSLRASNLCGAVGGSYPLETLAFGPSDLSTSSIVVNPGPIPVINPLGKWTAINYADFGPQCTCTKDCVYDPIERVYLTNLCTPQLSLPGKVTALDPAWATCVSDLGGVFDPPIALPMASGLTSPKSNPAKTTPDSGSTLPSVTPPIPVNSPTPPAPSPTPPVASSTPQPEIINQPPSQIDFPSPIPAQSSTLPVVLLPTMIGGASSPLPLPASIATPPPPLTINGQTVTANAQSNYVIGTQTLIPGGPAITVSGTPISLAPGATEIVVGGTSSRLGSLVPSVFGTTGAAAGATTGAAAGATTGKTTGTATGTAKGTAVVLTGETGRNLGIAVLRAVFIGAALSSLILWL